MGEQTNPEYWLQQFTRSLESIVAINMAAAGWTQRDVLSLSLHCIYFHTWNWWACYTPIGQRVQPVHTPAPLCCARTCDHESQLHSGGDTFACSFSKAETCCLQKAQLEWQSYSVAFVFFLTRRCCKLDYPPEWVPARGLNPDKWAATSSNWAESLPHQCHQDVLRQSVLLPHDVTDRLQTTRTLQT